jgi:hypothetical protein
MDRLAQSVFGGKTGQGAWLPAADIVETDSVYAIDDAHRKCSVLLGETAHR